MAAAPFAKVLLGGPADERAADALVIRLLPLALADGIVGEDHKSFSREIRRQQLPGRLSRVPMSHRHQNRWMPSGSVGTIQVRGHEIARQAFEQHVIDRETLAPGCLRHPRVERTSIVRQAANQRQHPRTHLSLSCLGVRPVSDGSNRAGAFTELALRQ